MIPKTTNKLVVANWKMHGNLKQNSALLTDFVKNLSHLKHTQVVVCAPYPYLAQLQNMLQNTNIAWGAQNVAKNEIGAFTGEVSAAMLRDFDASYVIIGHSERATAYCESDENIATKFVQAKKHGLTPILCVGETLNEREESKIGGGALRVVPGSQRKIQDACAVAEQHGWDLPNVIQVELEPGDVLLHDVMVLHGSERTLGQAMRRTVYYEFRAAEQILEEGPWDRDWIERRLRLVRLGHKQFAASNPQAPAFAWNVADSFRPATLEDDAQELKIAHVWHSPGAYCSATSAPVEVVARAMARLEASES